MAALVLIILLPLVFAVLAAIVVVRLSLLVIVGMFRFALSLAALVAPSARL